MFFADVLPKRGSPKRGSLKQPTQQAIKQPSQQVIKQALEQVFHHQRALMWTSSDTPGKMTLRNAQLIEKLFSGR